MTYFEANLDEFKQQMEDLISQVNVGVVEQNSQKVYQCTQVIQSLTWVAISRNRFDINAYVADIKFRNGLLDAFRNYKSRLINYCVEYNNVTLLRIFCECKEFGLVVEDIPAYTATKAIDNHAYECLEYLLRDCALRDTIVSRLLLEDEVTQAAAAGIKYLRLMHESCQRANVQMLWTKTTFETAAIAGDLEMLAYLVQHECEQSNESICCAARNGHLHCVLYLQSIGLLIPTEILYTCFTTYEERLASSSTETEACLRQGWNIDWCDVELRKWLFEMYENECTSFDTYKLSPKLREQIQAKMQEVYVQQQYARFVCAKYELCHDIVDYVLIDFF